MANTQQNDASRFPAATALRDVCSFSGRGTVCVVGQIERMIRVGDDMRLPDGPVQVVRPVRILGIEMIRCANPQAHPRDTIGSPPGALANRVHSLIGTRFCAEQRVP